MSWNRVVTVTDIYDGRPRRGCALMGEQLVYYECLWDEQADDYSDEYGISPIDADLLPLIEESWSIWIRWSDAFHSSQTNIDTHPALPADRSRNKEIDSILNSQLCVDHDNCQRFVAEFRSVQPGWNGCQVNWKGQSESEITR